MDHSPPEAVVVRDSEGNSVRIDVSYPRLPPKCVNCGKFGHLLNRCFQPLARKTPPLNPQKKKGEKKVATTTTTIPLAEQNEVPVSVEVILQPQSEPTADPRSSSLPPAKAKKKKKKNRQRSRSRALGRSASQVERLNSEVPSLREETLSQKSLDFPAEIQQLSDVNTSSIPPTSKAPPEVPSQEDPDSVC